MENKKESAVMNTAETEPDINAILEKQLLILAERSRNPKISADELCKLTSAMCEIFARW